MGDHIESNDHNELKIRLQELHDYLVNASHISAADRDMLSTMVVGILRLADDQKLTPATADDDNLRELLEQKSFVYEAEHPQLAFALHQVLDILSRMGI